MDLLRGIVIPFLCIAFSSTAQAAYLKIDFHGYVSSSHDEDGRLFGAGAGTDTILGREVVGSYRVDLGLAEYVSYDNDFGGDVLYSVEGRGLDRRFITSDVSIGGQAFSLRDGIFAAEDELDNESVYMGMGYDDELGEDHGFWQISDEASVPDSHSYMLDAGFAGPLLDYLASLTLDQAFSWHDDALSSGGGRLLVESNAGIGIAQFTLDSIQATRVAEPSALLFVLLGLVPLVARRRKSHLS